MSKDESAVSFKRACAMLKKGRKIHTMLNPGINILIGADWSRKDVLAAFKKYPVQLSGPSATAMHHGLVFYDGERHVFVETA